MDDYLVIGGGSAGAAWAGARTDAQIEAFIRNHADTIYHRAAASLH